MAPADRRKHTRMDLGVPTRVEGHDGDGSTWEEMSKSGNASFGGVALLLVHTVEIGQVLYLRLPLPKQFRQYALAEQSYLVYGLVRSVKPGRPSTVGVMFLGKNPPRGWEDNPGGRYLLPTDPAPKERRRWKRLENAFLNVKLRRPVEGVGPQEEITVAENIGKGGARVLTGVVVPEGTILEVEELGGPFRTRAAVKRAFLGRDNVPRLSLHFLDREAPDRLVS
jgi:PilZ domain-containing protein